MKRRITLSCALVLSIVLVPLMRSDSMMHAQSAATFPVGFTTLGTNQLLRITVVNINRNRSAQVRLGQQRYTQGTCNVGVCKHVVASQDMSAPVMLMPHEAASFEIPSTGSGVRGVVVSSSQDVQVTSMIVNSGTGEIMAIFTNDTIDKMDITF